jgi:predicted nucleotidyltransferase
MKKSLAHLPKHKRDELKHVKEIILDECPTVLMIVLFGSHARGDWVEDRHIEDGVLHEYMSDFDILVIVRSNKIANSTDTWPAETRARRSADLTSLIVESIETVNNAPGPAALLHGHQEEGVLLYDTGGSSRPPPQTRPRERRGNARATSAMVRPRRMHIVIRARFA